MFNDHYYTHILFCHRHSAKANQISLYYVSHRQAASKGMTTAINVRQVNGLLSRVDHHQCYRRQRTINIFSEVVRSYGRLKI